MFCLIIAIVIIIIVIVTTTRTAKPSGFVSQRAKDVHRQSKKAFQKNNTYKNFRSHVKDADPVIYTDLYKLYQTGNLHPEQVQLYV
jgi:hypothetical protein